MKIHTVNFNSSCQEQSDLQRAIFRGYDRKMRPVLNQSMPIIVRSNIALSHIFLFYAT
jgi:hypothetical protein